MESLFLVNGNGPPTYCTMFVATDETTAQVSQYYDNITIVFQIRKFNNNCNPAVLFENSINKSIIENAD